MSAEQESVSKQDLYKQFERLSESLRPEITAQQWAVRERVAVRIDYALDEMGSAADAGKLSEAMQEAVRRVLAESNVITAEDGTALWRLDHGPRQETLLRLANEERLLEVLNANPASNKSPLQEMFDATVHGDVLALEEQSLSQLEAMLQIVLWLEDCLPNLPHKAHLRRRITYERLVEPFRFLVGQHFSGRSKELSLLHDYIILADEAAFMEAHQELLARANDGPGSAAGDNPQQPTDDTLEKPKPLLIYGMGGIGKSTLLSYIILDPQISAGEKPPFVYIDFNRKDIDLENPLSILLEATTQLAVQNPEDEARWRDLGDKYQAVLKEPAEDPAQYDLESLASSHIRAWERYMYEFIDVLQSLQTGGKPLLLVLDTMEELLFHNIDYLDGLWEFLELLQNKLPSMRRILSGRTPLPDRFPVYNLLLDGLDQESAITVLRKRNVPDKAAEQIVASVGRIPLNLWLAAELYDRLPEEEKSFEALETRDNYFYQVKEYLIQGVLYRRILSYLHDDDMRLYQLAHPGLVLRRITPNLILNVLAKACDIQVNNLQEAEELFDRLRREVAIVEIDNARPQELRHRPELRLVMLELLMQDELATVNEIHHQAIEYSKKRISDTSDPDIRDRADYLYHRLALRDDKGIDPQFFGDYSESELQAIADELGRVIEDLPVEAQTALVSRVKINIQLDESVWETADLITWEHKTSRSLSALINRRQYEQALGRLDKRKERSPESPLLRLEIAALIGLKRFSKALQVITNGIQHAPPYSQTMQMLFVQQASIREDSFDYAGALQSYKQGLKIGARRGDKVEFLRIQLAITRLSRNVYHTDDEDATIREKNRLLAAWDALDDQELSGHTTLVRDVASQMAAQNPEIVVRALQLVGLHGTPPENIEHFARSLASWDDLRSGEKDTEPGMLAREVKAKWRGDLYTTWFEFLQKTDWERGSRRLQKLFINVQLTPTLAITLVELIKARLLLTTDEAQLLEETLASAFTSGELSTLLADQFDSPLDEITAATEYKRQIADVISWAESTGRLTMLLRALVAARPNQSHLLTLLEWLGINTDLLTITIDPEAAIAINEQTAEQAQEIGNLAQEFEAKIRLGFAYLERVQGDENANIIHAQESFLDAQVMHDAVADPQMSALMFTGLGNAYQRKNQTAEAVKAYEQALQIRQQIGDKAGEVSSLAIIGNTLYVAGSYQRAKDYIEQALNLARLTKNRIEVGNQLGNLGLVYHKLDNTEKAIELYQEAIEVRHEIGDRHGEAADLGNLGNAYRDLNQLEMAESFHLEALAISRSLGDRGGEVTDLYNLGRVYASEGNYDLAFETYQKALAIHERFLDSESLKSASLFNALGMLQHTKGDLKGAQIYYKQAIAIREDILGPDHPGTATSLNNLGNLMQDVGVYAEALPLLERSLTIREAQLGPDHPDTASSLNNLGALLSTQGDYTTARLYYERALAINEKVLGPDHPDIASSLNNLGNLMQDVGVYAEALPLLERSLTIREVQLGPDHPDTASSLNNLGALLSTQGDTAAARPYYERALAINEKVLGSDHPDTATSLSNLAGLLQVQGDYEGARLYYERALAIRKMALGPDHPSTANSLNNLANLIYKMDDYKQSSEQRIDTVKSEDTEIDAQIVTVGGDFVGGDKVIHGDVVHGDKVGGDKISGDKITVGNISGSTSIAIGSGAQATAKKFKNEENSVGRLELIGLSSRIMSTAYLIAPDLIMTTFHAIEALINQQIPPENLTIRFDLLETGGKSVVSQGQAYALAVGKEVQNRFGSKRPWLLAYDEELDFAILRLASAAGKDVVGGLRKGRRRGWLTLSPEADVNKGDSLHLIGLDTSGHVKSEVIEGSGFSFSDDGKRIRYQLTNRFGTSGAPLLNMNGDVIGMNVKFSDKTGASEAFLMSAIYKYLEKKGVLLEEFL